MESPVPVTPWWFVVQSTTNVLSGLGCMLVCSIIMTTEQSKQAPWGYILDEPDGFKIVRYRRCVIVYCRCGHGIVGEFPQRVTKFRPRRLQEYCFHCWREIPRRTVLSILIKLGFEGVSP